MFKCARGFWGQKSQGSLRDAQELEGRLEAEAILLCGLLSTLLKAGAHSQPSACAHHSVQVPEGFLLDPGLRGSQTSEGLS